MVALLSLTLLLFAGIFAHRAVEAAREDDVAGFLSSVAAAVLLVLVTLSVLTHSR